MDVRLRYDRDGIVFPLSVLTAAEVQRFRDACDRLENELGGRPRTIEVRQMHLHFRWAFDLATHPRVLDAVETLLGPNLLIWSTELFAKHPGDGISVGWHRDEDYTGFDPALSTTAWIALAPSTPENGCLQVILGSHRTCAPAVDCAAAELNPARPSLSTDPSASVALKPGEMSLHDGRLLHGSAANTCGEKRIGFAVRFVTPEAKAINGRPPVVLARGIDTHDHFQVVPPPGPSDDEQAVERMRQSASRHLDAVLANLRRKKTTVEATPEIQTR
jgi:hypothetical protein